MPTRDIAVYLTGWDAPVYNGQVQESAEIWISTIRYGLKQRRIPREYWVEVAFHFMGSEVRAVLDDAQQTIGREWDWDTLMFALIHIETQVKREASSGSVGDALSRFRREHPYAAAAAGVGLVTVGGITVAPAILVGTLNVLGFSASGVVGGSIAAGVQSAVYGGAVASGSLFSMAQSAAAGGVLVASVPVQAAGASVIGFGAWLFKKGGKNPAPGGGGGNIAGVSDDASARETSEDGTSIYSDYNPTPWGSDDDSVSDYATARGDSADESTVSAQEKRSG